MLELVFVIVVIGILAAVFIPRYERDNAGEAAYQIARHLRLAQHHALMEDRIDDAPPGIDWKETMWRITFINGSKGQCYQVHADYDGSGGNPAQSERAVDPLTNKWLWGNTDCSDTVTGVNDDILLWKSYGVSSLSVCGVATSAAGIKNIAFDHVGRPGQISGNTMNYLGNDCVISFNTNNGHSAEITLYKETGFVKVTKIDNTDLP
jgi:type II secretory pathway pseudopilin PulG